MKFETFKETMNLLLLEYRSSRKKDKELEKIFGSDSCIISELKYIDSMLNILKIEFNDKDDFIDWFFYEVLLNNDFDKKIIINNKEYKPTYKNIYKIITNKI